MRIFVSGPISAPTESEIIANAEIAQHIAYELIKKGHVPFIPHLSVYTSYRDKISYEEWLAYDDVWLRQCEALFFIEESSGANRELSRAREWGLQVFYNLDEVPDIRMEVENE